MIKCTLEIQEKVIDALVNYLSFELEDSTAFNMKDMNSYIGEDLGLSEFDLSSLFIEFSEENKDEINELFSDLTMGSFSNQVAITGRIKRDTTRFTSLDVLDLFHTLPLAKAYFEGVTGGLIVDHVFVGKNPKTPYIGSNDEMTRSLGELKESLFISIQEFLIDRNLLQRKKPYSLFNKNRSLRDYDDYKRVMNAIEKYFFEGGNYNLIDSRTGKKVPNIDVPIDTDEDIYNAYNQAVLLTNFDTIIKDLYGDLIEVNFDKFNDLEDYMDGDSKYKLNIEGLKTLYWKEDSHETESVESSASTLSSLLTSSIRIYNNKGIKTPWFLENKHFYLFSALLADFELKEGNRLKASDPSFMYFNENPVEALKWYLKNIESSLNSEEDSIAELKTYFETTSYFVKSLNNYLNSPERNILEKEKHQKGLSVLGVLAQVLNNSYGAVYIKYNADGSYDLQEMYRFNSNNIKVNGTIFSKLASKKEKSFFDVSSSKEKAKFDKLFEGLSGNQDMTYIPARNKIEISKYLKAKTGIGVNKLALDDVIFDLKDDKADTLTVDIFSHQLKTMLTAQVLDHDKVSEIADDIKRSFIQGDNTVGTYVSNTIGTKFFKALSNAYLSNYVLKPVMTLELLSGEKIPTFKTATLTYKDTELFEQQREFEKNPNNTYKSLLIRTPDGTTSNDKYVPVILGTGTRLELVNSRDNKTASIFSISESYVASFEFDFLKSIKDNNNFAITIGNYSDKKTILTKIINGAVTFNGKNIIQSSIDEILDLVQHQSARYYRDLTYKVFRDYKTIFDALKIKNSIKFDFNSFESKFDSNSLEINRILKGNDILELNRKYFKARLKDPDLPNIDIIQELHYSKYGDNLVLNQLVLDNFRLFNTDEKFKEFVRREEESLKNKFNEFNPDYRQTLKLVDGGNYAEYAKVLNLEQEDSEGNLVENLDLWNDQGLNPMLRKWQWLNALYRNEYLYMTAKGEYMHKTDKMNYRGDSSEIDWTERSADVSNRMSVMAKRNVLFTATIDAPLRATKRGVPDKINMAHIQDPEQKLYNISGQEHNQEVFDGGTFIDYLYGKMLDESFPGKGYFGTKKQFGTFITNHGVTIKKDAENIITNSSILTSGYSKVSLKNKKKQMNSLPINNLSFAYEGKFNDDYFYIQNGLTYRINSVKILDNNIIINRSQKLDDSYVTAPRISRKYNSLYDLWELFGSEYSVDRYGEFNEGSNDLLFEIITTEDKKGKYPLKEALIHMVSPNSAIKAGAINVNQVGRWEDEEALMYSTVENRFIGPQLDANHTAEDSRIKEVTQVISALAQNSDTAHLAHEVYEDLAKIIKNIRKVYDDALEKEDDSIYNYIAQQYIKTVEKSKGNDIAKTLLQTFANDKKIPFSNQHFFRSYVKDVITRINDEFITRYYSGIGAVLIPSQGIMQILQDKNGRILTQKDLAKEAIKWYNSIEGQEFKTDNADNDDIIRDYLVYGDKFAPTETTIGEIEPTDIIFVGSAIEGHTFIDNLGETQWIADNTIDLSEIDAYYNFKNDYLSGKYAGLKIWKVHGKPRDLRPSGATFQVGSNDSITRVHRNLFDITPVKLRHSYKNLNKLKKQNNNEFLLLNELARKFKIDIRSEKDMINLLNSWTQRNLQLMDKNLIMKDIFDEEFFKDGVFNLDLYFSDDSLINDVFEDVQNHYIEKNSQQIYNYKFTPAELILPDIYNKRFNRRESSSMYEVKNNENYFTESLSEKYILEEDSNNDIKLILDELDNPIYIRYVDQLPSFNTSDFNIKSEFEKDKTGFNIKTSRLSKLGNKMYTLPDTKNTRVINEDGREVILIKAYSHVNGYNRKHPSFNKNLSMLLNSFGNRISAFVPLMGTNISYSREVDGKNTIIGTLNQETAKKFNRFFNFSAEDTVYDKDWFKRNKNIFMENLGRKMFASWNKSHEFIAARIPAQSMQSFMEMKNVAYHNTKSNDAYVSIWQIWLQGSDFDIDKAYMLGHSFDKTGKYELNTQLSDYSTVEQLTALEKLPTPNGQSIEVSTDIGAVDLNLEFSAFINQLATESIGDELSVEMINILGRALRKIKDNSKIFINIVDSNLDMFIELLDDHNLSSLDNGNALGNSVVSKIKNIISAPSNQILANTPVDTKKLLNAANIAHDKNNIVESPLSPYDMFSAMKQQRDASVGNRVVGIAANGLKVFYAVSDYYNTIYDTDISKVSLDNIRRADSTFYKTFTYVDGSGTTNTISTATFSDVNIKRNQIDKLKESLGKDFSVLKSKAALSISDFTSAATDNAKVLVLSKINASVELSAMHLYMLSLGFTNTQVADFMTTNIVYEIIKNSESNMFSKDYRKRGINTIIKNMEQGTLSANDRINIETFKNIYEAAQEYSLLSRMLGANQRLSANIEEVHNFLNNYNNIIFGREDAVFKKSLGDLKKISNFKTNPSLNDLKDETATWEKILTNIFKNNSQLNAVEDSEYVKEILEKASKVEIDDGQGGIREVSLIGGQFDFRYYINPSKRNDNYRKLTKQYYNIIKNTLNVFDVIEKLPHFNEMIKGLTLSHNLLINTSKKYNFVFDTVIEVIRKNTDRLTKNSSGTFFNVLSNSDLPISYESRNISKALLYTDRMLLDRWLRLEENDDYTFNINELLSISGIEEIEMYTTDDARLSNSENVKINKDTKELFTVSLNTNYGIANFKKMMEEIILPYLQNVSNNNTLIDSLTVETRMNLLGIRGNTITSTFALGDLNNPINAEKSQKLMYEFNNLDTTSKVPKIKNSAGQELKWRDLFYVYNLIVNNDVYGDTKLTALFEDYLKEKNTKGFSFMEYSIDLDSGKIDLFNLKDRIDADEFNDAENIQDEVEKEEKIKRLYEVAQRQLENDIVFYAFQEKGELPVKSIVDGSGRTLSVTNPDFVVITSMSETAEQKKKYKELNDVLRSIKNKGFIITFEC